MKQVIVMRNDLNMRKGKMIAQGAHASMKVILDNQNSGHLHSEYINIWLRNKFTKICVQANSEEELLEIYENAMLVTPLVALITDNGLTEFKGKFTNTCIAIGPLHDEMFYGLTDHLKLL